MKIEADFYVGGLEKGSPDANTMNVHFYRLGYYTEGTFIINNLSIQIDLKKFRESDFPLGKKFHFTMEEKYLI